MKKKITNKKRNETSSSTRTGLSVFPMGSRKSRYHHGFEQFRLSTFKIIIKLSAKTAATHATTCLLCVLPKRRNRFKREVFISMRSRESYCTRCSVFMLTCWSHKICNPMLLHRRTKYLRRIKTENIPQILTILIPEHVSN